LVSVAEYGQDAVSKDLVATFLRDIVELVNDMLALDEFDSAEDIEASRLLTDRHDICILWEFGGLLYLPRNIFVLHIFLLLILLLQNLFSDA
jgi:hypothetical protein